MNAFDEQNDAVRKQLLAVEERLVVELRDRVSPDLVHQTIERELRRFAGAPVRQFIPVLVGRAARDRLTRIDSRRRAPS